MAKTVEGKLRLIWLEAFLAVHKYGSFSKAADSLGIHQTSVTRYMKALARWLRSPLIVTSEPITLTDKGQAFVSVAQEVCDALQRIRDPLPTERPKKMVSARDIKINPAAQVKRIKTKSKRAI